MEIIKMEKDRFTDKISHTCDVCENVVISNDENINEISANTEILRLRNELHNSRDLIKRLIRIISDFKTIIREFENESHTVL